MSRAARRRAKAYPSDVEVFDPAREAALYPDGTPLLARYAQGRFELGWVAAVHGADPRTFATIAGAFETIRPRSVLLEGFATALGPNPVPILASVSGGPSNETKVALAFAQATGALIWGAEPSERQRVNALLERGFSPVDVLFSAFFGPLEQDEREGRFTSTAEPAFDEAFAAWAAIIAEEQGVPDAPTANGFRSWFREAYGLPIDDDAEWWARGWPGREGVGSEVARASNYVRDVHAYEAAIVRLNADGRVVVVFGGSHLSSVWSALERSLGAPGVQRFPADRSPVRPGAERRNGAGLTRRAR